MPLWWHSHVAPAHRRLRKGNEEFEARWEYTPSFRRTEMHSENAQKKKGSLEREPCLFYVAGALCTQCLQDGGKTMT